MSTARPGLAMRDPEAANLLLVGIEPGCRWCNPFSSIIAPHTYLLDCGLSSPSIFPSNTPQFPKPTPTPDPNQTRNFPHPCPLIPLSTRDDEEEEEDEGETGESEESEEEGSTEEESSDEEVNGATSHSAPVHGPSCVPTVAPRTAAAAAAASSASTMKRGFLDKAGGAAPAANSAPLPGFVTIGNLPDVMSRAEFSKYIGQIIFACRDNIVSTMNRVFCTVGVAWYCAEHKPPRK